jgi:iron complex outermembrane receptor protein
MRLHDTATDAPANRQRGAGPRASLFAAFAAALTSGTPGAQSLDYGQLEELFGEPVTTSVTGSPQRESEVPASMRIITADQIRRSGARDIPGVLSHIAGVDVGRTSREQADVAVRGYNQAFTPRLLVLVDGRQVYADYFGFTPWSTIPVELSSIRQIEVVKGPAGALFGFNAVGGVVNIVTYDAFQEDSQSSVAARTGGPNLLEISASSSLRFGERSALRLSAGTRRSDEFSTAREPADFVSDRDNRRTAVSADAQFKLRPNVTFGFEITHSEADQIEMPPTYTMSMTEYVTESVRAHWAAETELGLVKAGVYKNGIEADAFLAGSSEPVLRFDNDVLVAQIEDIFKIGTSHVVRIGGEYRDNSMKTTPIGGASIGYEVLSLTSMWSWQVTPMLVLTNAVRIDEWQLGRKGYLPPDAVAAFELSNELWDVSRDEISFNTGLTWEMSDTASLKFAAGRGRQLPNLLSLGGNFSEFSGFYFLGTPGLEPTNVSNYELRWERIWIDSRIDLDLGVFRGETEDVQSAFFGNLGSSETVGFEAVIGGQVGERWGWGFSVLAQDIDDRLIDTFPAETTYVDFARTSPRRLIKARLSWTHGDWEVDAYLRHRSDSRGFRGPDPGDFSARLIAVPSHLAIDARIGRSLTEQLRLELAGRNLTRSRQLQTSAPQVEREVTATLEYAF